MAVHYTVIQYVPDPIRGERLNVGVAAYCDGHVRTKFLQNWQRVKDICGKSAPNREQFESVFQGIQQSSLVDMLSTWQNSIQFSEPGTFLGSMDEALDVASRRFLVDLAVLSKEGRLHSDVVSFAKHTLSAAISKQINSRAARKLVRRNIVVDGQLGFPRTFDLGLKDEKPIHLIQALSFARSKSIERSVEATAFLAQEIEGRFPFTVVVAPPAPGNAEYDYARRTLESYHARFVEEADFPNVAGELAEQLAA